MTLKQSLMQRAILTLAALVIFVGGCTARVVEQHALTIETKNSGPVVFHIELAVTDTQQEKGLMERSSMPDDAGMLFVFDDVAKRAFWMKDTLIPLDLLFIAEDGTVTHIHHMAKPLDLTRITSEGPVKSVLEINGGLSDVLGISEGDKIIHPVFRNQLPQ